MKLSLAARAVAWFLVFALGCGGQGGGASSASGSAGARGASASSGGALPAPTQPAGATLAPLPAGAELRVGVTLHPYYSWTRNVVGDAAGVTVTAVLPGDVDVDNYTPKPEDVAKLGKLDALVINGIGHDDFILDMIKASGNEKLIVIRVNDGTPTIKSAHGGSVNSHTFISFTNAIQQTYAIEKVLAALRPDLAQKFADNAAAYAKRLREIKADGAKRLASVKDPRVVTVHDGYSYFCQEFGVEVVGVVEPAHGLTPSAEELGGMIELLKKEKIQVVLSEETFPDKLLKTLVEGTSARVYTISHVATGEYTPDKFELEMRKNVDTLVEALTK
ncbi:MAG: zinc ABC transporter substrate-binding protein [Polyangiaceae bacterium]